MKSFLEEVAFDLSLMDEPEEPAGESHEGVASLEGGVTLCQSAGCPGDARNPGQILYRNQSQ